MFLIIFTAFFFWSVSCQSAMWKVDVDNDDTRAFMPEDGFGVYDDDAHPGRMIGAGKWVVNTADDSEYFFFGGYGYGVDDVKGALSDFWQYDEIGDRFRNFYGHGEVDVQATANNPSGKYYHMTFFNSNGDPAFFGGYTHGSNLKISSDNLWSFNVDSMTWTLLSGSITETPGNFSRHDAAVFQEEDDFSKVYIFGGKVVSEEGEAAIFKNDVFLIDLNTLTFTQVTESTTTGRYEEERKFNVLNHPSPRAGIASWITLDGEFLIFGGRNGDDYFNDLWEFSTTNNQWAFMGGSLESNQKGCYRRTLLEGDYWPGSRANHFFFTLTIDDEYEFYLLGGRGYADEAESLGLLNDMWKLSTLPDSTTKAEWEWLGHPNSIYIDRPAVHDGNLPEIGGREKGITFVSSIKPRLSNNLMIFGGSFQKTSTEVQSEAADILVFLQYEFTAMNYFNMYALYYLPIYLPSAVGCVILCICFFLILCSIICCCCPCTRKLIMAGGGGGVVKNTNNYAPKDSYDFNPNEEVTFEESSDEEKKVEEPKPIKEDSSDSDKELETQAGLGATEVTEDLEIIQDIFDLNYSDIEVVSDISVSKNGTNVFKCNFEGKTVAFKVYNVKFSTSDTQYFNEFEDSLEAIETMKHPNILKYYGCSTKLPKAGIVYDYCSNECIPVYIRNTAANRRKVSMPIKQKLSILVGICEGMKFLHENNVVHGDLKCQNVLLDLDLTPKIMDFIIAPLLERKAVNFKKRIGKSQHQAPEITNGEGISQMSDVYAFAIMMWEIYREDFLPYHAVGSAISMKVAKDENFRPMVDEDFPDWYVDLMRTCWSHNKDDRMMFDEIIGVLTIKMKEE